MASWKGSSKRKGWWEENVENEDKSAKRPKNLDEENYSSSSNSEPPEIEVDEKSWNKILSDNEESHVSEPWDGGMFSNQVGTSLRGGYNLPPALNEIGLMYSPSTPARTLSISGLKSRVLKLSFLSLKMLVKSGLEFILKFTEPLERYLLSCQANSAILGRYFCTGQQEL